MQTANARYGRPKGTGVDDRQRLASIAAALLADPKMKPTTAIRALGVSDPSTIRRLRDKFHLDQASLMAEARRAAHAKSPTQREVAKLAKLAQSGVRAEAPAETPPAPKSSPLSPLSTVPQSSLLVGCFDLGVFAVSTALESQSILTDYWLRLPVVSMALRGQLTLNSVAVAICMRGRKARLN